MSTARLKSILVVVRDPFAREQPALTKAAAIARRCGARVLIYNSFMVPQPVSDVPLDSREQIIESAIRLRRQRLAQVASRLRLRGAKCVVQWDFPTHEAALQIEPNVLNGSIYTSLGTLYHKVPGFPLGFGDDRKARGYLQKALSLNPESIDPNFFYGEYLYDRGEYEQARDYLQRALRAPDKDGRQIADAGRRKEAAQLLEKVKGKVG